MKKKTKFKQKPIEKNLRGAFDKNNVWWSEEDINNFTGGVVKMFFGIPKEEIKIIEK
jgi:hypothetical protein